MARELLCYRLLDDFYEESLERIAELVSAAGDPLRRPTHCLSSRLPLAT